VTTEFPRICDACQRLRGDGVCTSFDQGIPENIYVLGADHRQSIAGEEPFELDPAKQSAYEDWLQWAGEQ